MIKKYRPKVSEISALQLTRDNLEEALEFLNSRGDFKYFTMNIIPKVGIAIKYVDAKNPLQTQLPIGFWIIDNGLELTWFSNSEFISNYEEIDSTENEEQK